MNKTSWKTTTGGVLGAVAIIIGAAQALLDNDPLTNPNWEMVIGALSLCAGLIFARDNNKTSAQVGAEPAKPEEPLIRVDVPTSKNNPLTYLWLIVPLLFVSGCSMSSYAHGDIKITQRRFLWDTTGFEVSQTKGVDGSMTTTLKLQKSNPNAEAVKAVAEGITQGLVQGAGKAIVPVP